MDAPQLGQQKTPSRRPKLPRSRITSGRSLLDGADHRFRWMRRLADLIDLHLSDLGGPDTATEAEKAIIRRAATLIVELENLERKFALNGDGAGHKQLLLYQRCSNTLRRLLESVGLQRRAKEIVPTLKQYLESTAEAHE